MFRFIMTMLIPIWVGIYTFQFGRWVKTKQNPVGSYAAFIIAVGSVATSGWVLWRITH
ncbi:hypothetical protein [Alicyclobacillus ferrooxydans]|uniref:hypothetical protein n=1 Tax=Alicyclobacillus ferrooxydans TaxID=471514 RepID=UPI0012ED1FEE|nr:hypothetical protein [Alicyclobacillus ferrooxydans]